MSIIEPEDEATPLPPHKYRLVVNVLKDDELVAKVGHTAYGGDKFTEVVQDLSDGLAEKWLQVVGMASIIDAEETTPKPEPEPDALPAPTQREEVTRGENHQDPWWKRWLGRRRP